MQDGIIRVAVIEQVLLRILQKPLDCKLDIDDIFIIGQHERFFEHPILVRAAIAHLDNAHIGQANDFVCLNRIGQTPTQARLGRLGIAAECQDDASLRSIDDVETARQPDHQHQHNQRTDTATKDL